VDAHVVVRAAGQSPLAVKGILKCSVACSAAFWRIAVLTAAGMVTAASSAEAAAYYYWPNNYGYYQQPQYAPQAPRYRHKAAKQRVPKVTKAEQIAQEGKKPTGPLIIAISIDRQSLKIYDANGFFAETPISTGMRGHPTPMGVFSIIQKHKLHRSNIYSGAPMPYMQRITWSGIAMHAGVLPGHPASHGCIRMPMNFAVKMWGWTKMGARVVVTPGDIAPANFSHPLLVTQKPVPQPVANAEPQTDTPPASKSDKGANAGTTAPEIASAKLELKPSVGSDVAMASPDQPDASMPREQTRTADASNSLSGSAVTISDATPTAAEAKPAKAEKTDDVKADAIKVDEAKRDDNIKAAIEVAPPAPDPKKDQTRANEMQKKADAAAALKRRGQISVFISRKDSKLYVRQNFSPLFDSPVTIAPSDRPLGTHVFTAQVDKADANVFHWSVVSLPARHVERSDEDDRPSRRRKITGAVEVKPVPVPDTAAEALDRLTIPQDAMARIVDLLSTGGSIIVSDQGITAGETGEGTDFIVSLR
jgi:lipoprotein-anchoring transpeptidase ErfK/SrfK